ncbi:membrane protein [Marinicella pacifica]|uniref:Membrane protein n=1 Tax=Marinicella pacifica TaxID=1171543 RepID=A0A917FS06_9GAMM|nr:glycosyltransferase family 39 protein [Marinicella pacifica]GGG02797.1 membrane protein [Marinicella pacifica]
MLDGIAGRRLFWGLVATLVTLQLLLATQTELFGDEAFYWLESRFPDWSYSEIPGFVPWLNVLTTAVLPQHPFFLRLPFLLACWCLPWLGYALSFGLSQSTQAARHGALFTLILPLLGLTGVLAIADIWLVFFTLLAVFLWLRLLQTQSARPALLLGLTLMLAVNVHIRFWFVLFIALLAAAVVYKQKLFKLKPLWQITLPLTLLGFVPIVIFNIQQGFPLLEFQLGERNPWQFQLNHGWFFIGQIIITTPLVFYLCLLSLKKPQPNRPNLQARRFIQLLAVLYWLLYALLGFFSDNLRTNIHWPLPAYLLLLLVAAADVSHRLQLKRWAVITGGLAHVGLLMVFYGLLHLWPVDSNTHKQLINNAIGWQQLAAKTEQLQQPGQAVIADYFMTAAALSYYRDNTRPVAALPHPMNVKHGRQKQLALMGLFYQDSPQQPVLLVVEHSALKLSQQIGFYQQSCEQLDGLQLVDDLSIASGSKLYYFFVSNSGYCELPPIVYHDFADGEHRGWVVAEKNAQTQINDISQTGLSKPIKTRALSLGNNVLFRDLDPERYQRLSYSLKSHQNIQLQIHKDHKTITTRRFYR